MPRINLRHRLLNGETVGVVSGHHNMDMVEWLGQFRPDAIWMECEHGPGSWEQIGDFSRACDLWGVGSIVRVNANEPWLITRTLDRGASGIVVPHVCTRAGAEAVAEACRFGRSDFVACMAAGGPMECLTTTPTPTTKSFQ